MLATTGAIAQTGISSGQQPIAHPVFALAGSLGGSAPVVIYFALGERSKSCWPGLKDWMTSTTR